MCHLELHVPEFPLLCTLQRVGHGKPSEGSGGGCEAWQCYATVWLTQVVTYLWAQGLLWGL